MLNIDRQRMFTQTLEALFRAQQDIQDSFFNRRMGDAIVAILQEHAHLASQESGQGQEMRNYIHTLKSINQLLDEITYVTGARIVSLALAQERLLWYLRDTILEVKKLEIKPVETQQVLKAPYSVPETLIPDENPTRLSNTQAKILEFIRKAPERRSKEIIDEFSALSGRTIKRGLKELSQEGFIVKKTENNAVYYSAA